MTTFGKRKDGQFYKKSGSKILSRRGTINAQQGIKMKRTPQLVTTRKSEPYRIRDEGILPVFDNYIKKHYPKGRLIKPTNWFEMAPQTHDDQRWTRPLQVRHVYGNKPEFEMYMHQGMIEDKDYVRQETLQTWYAMQRNEKNRKLQLEFLKLYTEDYAKNQYDTYHKYGHFDELQAIKMGKGFGIAELQSPSQQFLQDVMDGKVRNDAGLRLSKNQIKGLAPAGGYMHEVLGTQNPQAVEDARNIGYYSGLVVKISGYNDKTLPHNTWGVITDVLDDYHYLVYLEGTGDAALIRDADVKGLIGDMKTDILGLGDERHKKEVIPFIKEAMENMKQ